MSSEQPLAGIVALDVTEDHNGYAGKLFADLGADVIKVERGDGDPARYTPPFTADDPHPNASAFFGFLNTGKRGLLLDPDDGDDRDLLGGLAAGADVVFEDHLPAYGISPEEFLDRHPETVVVSLSGFGRSGPRAGAESVEIVESAMGGLMYLTGYPDDPPTRPGLSVDTYLGALYGTVGALLALRARGAVGGQHVDASKQEAIVTNLEASHTEYAYNGRVSERNGNRHPMGHPMGEIYPAEDGYVCICLSGSAVEGPLGGTDISMWEPFCELIDRPDLLEDERFNARADENLGGYVKRLRNADELDEIIEQETAGWDAEEFYRRSQENGMSNAPVATAEDILGNRQLEHRGFFTDLELPNGETVTAPGTPYDFSKAVPNPTRAPRLDEHADELAGAAAEPSAADRDPPEDAPAPLDGIRVLDFTMAWAGPSMTRLLADHGADVIKVESVQYNDITRSATPFYGDTQSDPTHGEDRSGYYNTYNAGKRSLAVNLRTEEGRELIREIVAEGDVDVVVESFAPGTIERMGLGYEDLRELNDDLVMCSISGYGQEGPESGYRAYGAMLGPHTGTASVTGFDEPVRSGVAFADPVSAGHAAFAILTALHHRDEGGGGQYIDLAMLEAGSMLVHQAITHYALTGEEFGRRGNRDERDRYVQGCYRCAEDDTDGEPWIAITVRDQSDWHALRAALDYPEWTDSDRFADQQARLDNHDALDERIGAWTRERGRYDVMDRLQDAGVPAGVVQTTADLLERDDHLDARGFWGTTDHPVVGEQPYPGALPVLSETPGRLGGYAPMLGQHTREVLYDLLSLSGERIAELEHDGVLA